MRKHPAAIQTVATPAAACLVCACLLALGSLAGCSSPSGGTTGTNDVGADTVVPDATPDTQPDIATDDQGTDEGSGRRCTPGTARCISEHESETCSQDSVWVQQNCTDSQLCWGGSCGDLGTCEAQSVDECEGYTRYRGCNPVGTGTGEFDVPFNLTCISDDQGPRLVPRTCLQGETRCDGEQVLQRCAESGLDFEFSTNCHDDDATTLCDDGQCISLCQYIAKQDTYVGCEYWALDLDNIFEVDGSEVLDAFHSQFAVAISNPGETLPADITIQSADTVLATGTVDPGGMQVFPLPFAEIEGTMHGLQGYRITSTIPIVAYQFNPLTNEHVFSNDASILFPTSSLGTDYYVMTRHQLDDHSRAFVTVVATQPGDTDVTVRLPEYSLTNPLVTLAGSDIPPLRGGDEYTLTLQQYEVFNLETNKDGTDLTGTYVEATRPVGVFGGVEGGSAPDTEDCVYRERQQDWVCAFDRQTNCFDPQLGEPTIDRCAAFWTCCLDHLEHQMPPISTWGREFNAARSRQRLHEGDVWRIMAGADNTSVTLVGIPTDDPNEPVRTSYTGDYALNAGQWIEFESWADFEILATGPIFVGQFLVGLHNPGPGAPPPNSDYNGDPTFIMVPPREQYRSDYIFLVPAEYAHNFVTIVVPTGTSIAHTDEVSSEVFEADTFTPFASGAYSVRRVELANEGYHRLTSITPEGQQDAPRFGLTVYGYDDDVSYGYVGGLDLKAINR